MPSILVESTPIQWYEEGQLLWLALENAKHAYHQGEEGDYMKLATLLFAWNVWHRHLHRQPLAMRHVTIEDSAE